MDFYHAPGTCSQATHILLHHANLEFLLHKVDIFTHTLEDGSDYRLINPNGYVPALVLDGGVVLTENAAIIDWICSQVPKLVPGGVMGRTLQLQMLAFISTELHKPFVPLFFIEDQEEQARIREALAHRFRWISTRMEGDFFFGDCFSGVDAFLYVMLRWAEMISLETPPVFAAFVKRVEGLEAVQTALLADGLKPLRISK